MEVMILITPTRIVSSLDLISVFSIAAFELGHLTVRVGSRSLSNWTI